MKKVATDQLTLLFQGHLGLIVGPRLTLGAGAFDAASAAVATAFNVEVGATYLDTCDAALKQGHAREAVAETIAKVFVSAEPQPLTPRLARVRWGAIISFAPDTSLEELLRSEGDKSAFRAQTVVIESPGLPIPPRHVPVLKMLGTVGRETLLTSKYEYSRMRPRWRTAIRAFLDLTKTAPVVCVGMSDIPWALADILAELGSAPVFPRQLIMMETDPLVISEEIDRMMDPRIELVVSRGAVGDLLQAAEAGLVTPHGISPRPIAAAGPEQLRPFTDLAAVVTAGDPLVTKEERQQLLELLFSPTSARWDPFAHELDFRRTLDADVIAELDEQLTKERGGDVAVIEGAAATGKTVLLKRVAYELAKKGHLVLWLRPYFYPDLSSRIAQLFKTLSKVAPRGVCILQDDPYALGSVSLKEVAIAARSNDVSAKFLVGLRTSEWKTREPADLLGPVKLFATHHLSDSLDEDEWLRLETYLQTLGIARTPEEARQQLAGAASRSARDTLSMLYWLVPHTRAHIQESIKQEYFRLGDQAGFARVVLGQAEHSSDILRRAYEMVAVANKYRASVPIEVLVTALEVPYQAWLDETSTSEAAWGLLYAEENMEAETILYRTRNDVVSNVLINALNGGSFSHSGEVRILRSLLDACTGSHPSYREFAMRILVKNDALEGLEYADVLALYDRALRASPFPDKTLLHHKGIWIRRKGRKPLEALKIFEQALITEPSPYARRGEANEHIHTSAAAAIIEAMEEGLISVQAGKEQALAELARSKSGNFFNASAVHVYANLVLKLSDRLGGIATLDSQHLVATAVADVDRTVLILKASAARDAGEDVAMLRQVRDKILVNVVDADDAREHAEQAWLAHQNQDGFGLAARALLHAARQTGKGSAFKSAWEYCNDCIAKVRTAGAVPSGALHDARVHTLYEWRVHAWRDRPRGGFIDWKVFYEDIIASLPGVGSSPLYRYFAGVALAHLEKWNDAAGSFAQVRQSRVPADLLWSRRDMLLDRHGDPRELQGTVRSSHDRLFLHVEALATDFQADRDAKWPRPGEISVCCVAFSFGGPTAIARRP